MDGAYSLLRRGLSKLRKSTSPSMAAVVSATSAASTSAKSNVKLNKEEEEKLYGITDRLVEFVKSFSIDTFRNFHIADEEENTSDGGNQGYIRVDLSEWQETHAKLVLLKVKELAELRFRLCPRYLKERRFWRIYFSLVRSYVAECEARAVQLAKLKNITSGNDDSASKFIGLEVEMLETNYRTCLEPEISMEHEQKS